MVTKFFLLTTTFLGSVGSETLISLAVLRTDWDAVDKTSLHATSISACAAQFRRRGLPKGIFRFDADARSCEWPVPGSAQGIWLEDEVTESHATLFSPASLWEGGMWHTLLDRFITRVSGKIFIHLKKLHFSIGDLVGISYFLTNDADAGMTADDSWVRMRQVKAHSRTS